MQTCEFLKDVTEKRAKCLQAFVDCENLVQWLKQSMKTCKFSGLVGHLCYPVFIIKPVTSQSPCYSELVAVTYASLFMIKSKVKSKVKNKK